MNGLGVGFLVFGMILILNSSITIGVILCVIGLLVWVGGMLEEKKIAEEQAEADKKRRKENKERKAHIKANVMKMYEDVDAPLSARYYYWRIGHSQNSIIFFDAPTPYFEILTDTKIMRKKLLNITSVQAEYSYESSFETTRNGVIKRSIIGGVLAGGVGAVIGGLTADSNTLNHTRILETYVKLNIADIDFPTIKLYTNGLEEAERAVGMINSFIVNYSIPN